MNIFIVDAVHYARAAVATIGILNFTYGCLSHELQVSVNKGTVVMVTTSLLMQDNNWYKI